MWVVLPHNIWVTRRVPGLLPLASHLSTAPGSSRAMSRYHRSSIICVKLTPAVSAQATFCPTPGGCPNLPSPVQSQ